MDTCKAANLYASQPAEFMTYVNAPIGAGRKVPGPVKPHIACPTTCGTGSETTGIAIFNLRSLNAKTGIISRRLIPEIALIDPTVTSSLQNTGNVLSPTARRISPMVMFSGGLLNLYPPRGPRTLVTMPLLRRWTNNCSRKLREMF